MRRLPPACAPLLLLLCSAALLSAADSREARREAAQTASLKVHLLRLHPGEDLLQAIHAYVKEKQIAAGVILTTVGSLTQTTLRLADRRQPTTTTGKREIVSLVGTVEPGGGHLHLSVSDGKGVTLGGHLLEGCKIYTTAEIAIGELPGLRFLREPDPTSGYEELKIEKKP